MERRKLLLEAGLELFGTRGFAATSVDEVCAEAGLTKRYFYHSFADIEALLLMVYREANARAQAAVLDAVRSGGGTDPNGVAMHAVAGYFRALDRDRRLARITLAEIFGVSPQMDAACRDEIAGWCMAITSLLGNYEYPGVRNEIMVQTVWGLLAGTAMRWYVADYDEPIEEVIAAVQAVIGAVTPALRMAKAKKG